jgi:hypothetical protein
MILGDVFLFYRRQRPATNAKLFSLVTLAVAVGSDGAEAELIFRRGDERTDHRVLFAHVEVASIAEAFSDAHGATASLIFSGENKTG